MPALGCRCWCCEMVEREVRRAESTRVSVGSSAGLEGQVGVRW